MALTPEKFAEEQNAEAVKTMISASGSQDSTSYATPSSPPAPTTAVQARPDDPTLGPVGCYLVFEPNSGGRLMLHYSEGHIPENAVGFFCCGAGHKIQGFKFKQAAGRSELIKGIAGGDANRRKYFVGWCQFLKLAKAKAGRVIQFDAASRQGVPVDVYGFIQSQNQPDLLELEGGLVDISAYDAVAVMPKHHEFLKGVKSTTMSTFLEMGNLAGATTKLA